MSKIEKALSKAREERGNLQVVPVARGSEMAAPSTALVTERVGHPETIARMTARESRLLTPDELAKHGIIHKKYLADSTVQVFRELRTKIVQHSRGQNRVILVTGARKRSGCSFVARNLAAAFAFDDVRTSLVIDCNFKAPSLHRLVANQSSKGLADYLEDPTMDAGEIIHPVGIARLRVIPAGRRPDSQTEHFSSVKMRRLMDSVRRRYADRYVVLDGPPMSESADIRILSEFADYVLIVARYGRATNAQIEKCLGEIGKEKLLGIVFNDEPRIPWFR